MMHLLYNFNVLKMYIFCFHFLYSFSLLKTGLASTYDNARNNSYNYYTSGSTVEVLCVKVTQQCCN